MERESVDEIKVQKKRLLGFAIFSLVGGIILGGVLVLAGIASLYASIDSGPGFHPSQGVILTVLFLVFAGFLSGIIGLQSSKKIAIPGIIFCALDLAPFISAMVNNYHRFFFLPYFTH
jgi:hypothetical protein